MPSHTLAALWLISTYHGDHESFFKHPKHDMSADVALTSSHQDMKAFPEVAK
jgi:hypothetical protein